MRDAHGLREAPHAVSDVTRSSADRDLGLAGRERLHRTSVRERRRRPRVPVLSVLTATLPRADRAGYLAQTAASIAALAGDVQWVIHVDGGPPQPEQIEAVAAKPGVVVQHAPPGGLFAARNRLLTVATAPLVLFVDDDDVVCAEGVTEAVQALSDQSLHWATGTVIDWDGGRDLGVFGPLAGTGRLAAGAAVAHWGRTDDAVPLVLNATVCRRASLLALGGVPALVQAGDLAAVLRLAQRYDGWAGDLPVFRYRQHPGQWTRRAHWWRVERPERLAVRMMLDALVGASASGVALAEA